MPRATFFSQGCPTCGRRLQIRVKYLGRVVVCQHCRGRFEATDMEGTPVVVEESGIGLLARVDQLLASSDDSKKHPR